MQNDCRYSLRENIHKTILYFRTINSRLGCLTLVSTIINVLVLQLFYVKRKFMVSRIYFPFFSYLDILEHVVWMKLQIEWIYILCSIGNVFKICDINFYLLRNFNFITNQTLSRDWYCLQLSIRRHNICLILYVHPLASVIDQIIVINGNNATQIKYF